MSTHLSGKKRSMRHLIQRNAATTAQQHNRLDEWARLKKWVSYVCLSPQKPPSRPASITSSQEERSWGTDGRAGSRNRRNNYCFSCLLLLSHSLRYPQKRLRCV